MIPLLNYVNTYLSNFLKNWYRKAVKNGQLAYNKSTFMPIFYACTLGFSVATYKQIRTGI